MAFSLCEVLKFCSQYPTSIPTLLKLFKSKQVIEGREVVVAGAVTRKRCYLLRSGYWKSALKTTWNFRMGFQKGRARAAGCTHQFKEDHHHELHQRLEDPLHELHRFLKEPCHELHQRLEEPCHKLHELRQIVERPHHPLE